MSLNDKAAEVAEDYRHALEDLTMNSRYEISNLTVVARENTEHALAISETLMDHIKQVPAQRKLPALYVLDSIVKNVGTPYTLFFGRKLYQTFMDAYASVDNMTRRKMDEMLKTWKEPVPGSIDTRPVFPPDVVRPIENALIKARTTALQAQQESIRGQHQLLSGRRGPPPQQYRNTPTPPGFRPGSQQPGPYGQPPPGVNGMQQPQQAYPMHNNNAPQPPYPARSTPQSAYPYQQAPAAAPTPQHQPVQGISIDSLNSDIQHLIAATRAELAAAPLDAGVQTRLRALLDLQSVLAHQNLNQDQLVLVKNQVAELAVKINQHRTTVVLPTTGAQQPPPPPASSYIASTPIPHPPQVAVAPPPRAPATAPPPPAAAGGGLTLDSLFGQGALATLLAGASKPATPVVVPTPVPAPAPPPAAIRSPPPAAKPAAVPADPMALMAMLRQSGLLPPPPSSSAPPVSARVPPPVQQLPQSLAGLLSPRKGPSQQQVVGNALSGDIQLRTSSLKKYRPHLIPLLYEDLGPPCTQCGRRFRTDDVGRRKKTAHMDWHFRVHQRIAEAEKRGQHRSWYVDREDWIKSREAVDTDYVAPATTTASGEDSGTAEGGRGSGGGGGGEKAGKKLQYIPVPEDTSVNTVCPICQEKFEMKWLDEAQEWVWMDAVMVGGRVYHGSCYGEATKGGGSGGGNERGGTPVKATGTPEPSVLGKRKAEDELPSLRGKVKLEGY